MTTNHYHNTTFLEGDELNEAIRKAIRQDDKVLIYFQNNPDKSFTPSQIHEAIFDDSVPLTSTRRAMSNLTRVGKLAKTEDTAKGLYGRRESMWKLYNWDLTKRE